MALQSLPSEATSSPDPGYEVMARTPTGAPISRSNCRIHYKINVDSHKDRGRASVGMDVVTEIHRSASELGSMTDTTWVFDGYTHVRWGSTSGTGWATSKGVLIELTNRGGWSQPYPEKGPSYTGGIVWLNMDQYARSGSLDDLASVRGNIRHELAHQYGLGDLYDSKPVSHSVAVRMYNRMGSSRAAWGAGDRNGLKLLAKYPRAVCGR